MPTLLENLDRWDRRYEWRDGGGEWSAAWGGPAAQWYGTVLPRIHPFLPADHVVEIGSGFGRWSRFLRRQCLQLTLVDLSPRCVDACTSLFEGDDAVACVRTDGASLPAVGDLAADFVFSFDSLVHAEIDVVEGYISELARVLSPDGVAFLHHSNLAAHPFAVRAAEVLPAAVRRRPPFKELVDLHWRATSVSAERVGEVAARHGLRCLGQELVRWQSRRHATKAGRLGPPVPSDAFSILTRTTSSWTGEERRSYNRWFKAEAPVAAARASYGARRG